MRRVLTVLLALLLATSAWAQAAPPAKAADPPKKEAEPPKKAEEPPKKAEEPPKKAEEPPKKVEEPPKKVEEPPKVTKKKKKKKSDDDDDDDFDDFDDDGGKDDWGKDDDEPQYPRFTHKGYFRFRADMFGDLHLGTQFRLPGGNITVGTSGFKPPLTENVINNQNPQFGAGTVGSGNEEPMLASANLRFRYQPTFHISDSWKFTATFDVLDNLVMGSTPDFNFARPDAPFSVFASSQAPPGKEFQFQDSIRVKELYGEWRIFGAPIRFGRMASHWGLGILANGGNNWDDDFGDYVDRVMVAIQLYGVYIAGGYDIVSSGPAYKQPFQPFGQAYDMTETDDVQQGFLAIFMKPLQDKEVKQRRLDLVKNRKPVFDWGVYCVFRRQELDISQSSLDEIRKNPDTFDPDKVEMIKRDAWAVIPDIWLRFQYWPNYKMKLRLELEAAMIIGNINKVQDDPTDLERKVMSWAFAFEGEFQYSDLTVGLMAGAASGDDAEFLGVLDQKNFAQTRADGSTVFNTKITNFKFDRNYHVDQILFREVIGAVTNAFYIKPWVQYDLYASEDGAIGGRLDLLWAGAMEKKAYPGDALNLGVELDAKIFYHDRNKFYADVSFGVYFPGEAFALKNGFLGYSGATKDPVTAAWTLQAHIVMMF